MLGFRSQFSVLLFVALICLPSIAAAQRNELTGHSTITGRVIFADTGRPARRVNVQLLLNLSQYPVRTTPTNQRGEFRFTEVAAGSYFVIAESPGIISPRSSFTITEFGIHSYNTEAEHTRVTVDGKNTSRCEVRAVRAGTIKGTITYVDKEPVVNARLVLFRLQGGVATLFFSEPAFTNDRGMYRIDGLPAGEYVVGVVTGTTSAHKVEILRGQSELPSTFYPGASSLAEAKPIQIQPGTEATGINMTIGDDDLPWISGKLKWRSGEVVKSGTVTIRRKNEPRTDVSFPGLYRINMGNRQDMMRDAMLITLALPPLVDLTDEGEWQFPDLAPGTYILTAYAALAKKNKPANPDGEPEPAESVGFGDARFVSREVEVTVGEESRTDLVIELSEGGRVLGSITMADGSPLPRIPVSVASEHKADSILNMPNLSKEDGTFLIEGVSAGEVRVDVDLFGGGDLYLKSITLGGQDLRRETLTVNDGAEVAGVRITLGEGLATLKGRAQLKEDGSPAAAAGILLVNADPKLWHARSSQCFANTDAVGAFTLTCAPGDYLVITWPAGAQPLEAGKEFIRARASSARTVSLQSKEEKHIELTVNAPLK